MARQAKAAPPQGRPVAARLTDLAAELVEADEGHAEAQRELERAVGRHAEAVERLEKATARVVKAKEDLENYVRAGE